jgi:hypothetical protein
VTSYREGFKVGREHVGTLMERMGDVIPKNLGNSKLE